MLVIVVERTEVWPKLFTVRPVGTPIGHLRVEDHDEWFALAHLSVVVNHVFGGAPKFRPSWAKCGPRPILD
jgi:hypothetical protein